MDYTLQNWILTCVVIIMAGILAYIIKTITSEVLKKLDVMVDELKTIGRNLTSQEERIKHLNDSVSDMTIRMNNHEERLFRVEYKNQ